MVRQNNAEPEFRGKIYDSIIDTVGATPLVRLNRLTLEEGCNAEILCKCEFFNPLASVKDRIGVAMIDAAEAEGLIGPGSVIVEPTSGNTGISLAFVCAAKGYDLILTIPDSVPSEIRKMLELLGAKIEFTPAEKGMPGAIKKANEIAAGNPRAYIPQQFSNPANPDIHRKTTAEEIWGDTGGKVDAVIIGVGSGGTLTGITDVLKKRNPNVQVIAVEPEDSSVLAGGLPGPHGIQGIGAGFIPDNLNTDLIDEVISISNFTSFQMAKRAASSEGLPIGISSGAAIAAALEIGARPEWEGKTIVTILPSFAERYLSSALFDVTFMAA